MFSWSSPIDFPPQHLLLSLAEDDIEGDGLSHFGKLLSLPGSPPCIIRGIKLLFVFSCQFVLYHRIMRRAKYPRREKKKQIPPQQHLPGTRASTSSQ